MASEPFDLGHGISVRKTCSVGWAAYPWCRPAFEAICPEESIALADAALYIAKGMGRNQGVGIVPGESAHASPEPITLIAAREGKSPLCRLVKTPCPGAASQSLVTFDPAEVIPEKS
jgi:hypothetical protein